ncbi:unnamed protein product [Rhizophagus irregularis]|nr:unnamed protein product [Rhizophagus irregularis]
MTPTLLNLIAIYFISIYNLFVLFSLIFDYFSHLAKCPNFREYVDDDEVQEILALSVPEDNKKKRKEPNKDDKDDDSTEENNFSKRRRLSTSSSMTQPSSFSHQSSIINFYRRSLSTSELSLLKYYCFV